MDNQIFVTMPMDEFWQKIQSLLEKIVKEQLPIPSKSDDVLLTREELADWLQVSKQWVLDRTKDGKIKGGRIEGVVRYRKGDVLAAWIFRPN